MASSARRAIVLGADIEGLAAAATLAQSGLEVHLVDRFEQPGGVSRPVEFHAGHTVPGLLHETSLVRRKLLGHLSLEQHGLRWRGAESAVHVGNGDGRVLTMLRDSIDGSPDAGAYTSWRAHVDRLSPLIVSILDNAPPESRNPGMKDVLDLAMTGLKLRALGKADMMELLRIVTMPAWDWMEECFEDPVLRAGLTALVLPGTVIGPRAAGTTAMMLMREAARGPEPIGGLGAVTAALAACCAELGVVMHLGVAPVSIQAGNSEAPVVTGVELDNGEVIEARLVLSTLDPQATLLDLVHPGLIPHHIETEVQNWRTRGSSAVHLLALSRVLDLPGGAQRIVTATSPLELERAADALKYGELPEAPWLDVRDWSGSGVGLAPDGAGTLSVHVHGVPRDLKGGWTDARRAGLREQVLTALEKLIPDLRACLAGDELLTPVELEDRFGLRGGQIYGGEQVLDQLWVQRPSLALCRYESPLRGLFMGGAANHPGGPFVGGAGVLAARRALKG
ncbi:MAG: phytoene dehydrogenase-like protein [Chlamydiales bacterium]|jgi:phytoene dehydrogenase-like protein